MTSDSRLNSLVEDLLLDAGHAEDAELRAALHALGSLGSLPVPAPSGELARLMLAAEEAPAPAPEAGEDTTFAGERADELARRRRRNFHRPTALGLALIAGMATGIGGVAASSPAPGEAGRSSVQELLADWSPSWSLPAQAVPGLLPPAVPDAEAMSGSEAAEAVMVVPVTPAVGPADQPQDVQQPSPAQSADAANAAEPARSITGAVTGNRQNTPQESSKGRPPAQAPAGNGASGQPNPGNAGTLSEVHTVRPDGALHRNLHPVPSR